MAGLLDAFNTDDARLGIGLLAAAGPSATPMGFGQRLQGALGAFDANKLQQKKLGLLDAQMDNLKSEAATRQAALATKQAILDLFKPDPAGASMLTTQPGQLGSGSFGIVSPPAGMPAVPQGAPAGASRIGALTPDKLAQLKLLGADLTEIYKLTQPDIEFVNGVAVNKKATAPGTSIPQMSPNGQGYQLIPDPSAPGGFRVSTPAGALDTFTQFKKAEAQINADNDLVKIVGPDGAERYVSRSTVLGGAKPPAPSAPVRPNALVQPGDADRAAIFGQEMQAAQARLASAKTPEEQNRASTDIASLEREIRALPASAQPPGFQATPTTAQAAEKAAALKQAEADVEPTAQRKNEIANANYMLSLIGMLKEHPGLETATGMSGTLDPRNYLPGTDAKNFQVLKDQLKGNVFMQAYAGLKGGGQITEVEGAKAENALARLNTAQSTDEFRKALGDFEGVVRSGLERMKSGAKAAGVPTEFPGDNKDFGKSLVAELPKTAAKGTRARDTTSGRVMVFNGLSWVPEKR